MATEDIYIEPTEMVYYYKGADSKSIIKNENEALHFSGLSHDSTPEFHVLGFSYISPADKQITKINVKYYLTRPKNVSNIIDFEFYITRVDPHLLPRSYFELKRFAGMDEPFYESTDTVTPPSSSSSSGINRLFNKNLENKDALRTISKDRFINVYICITPDRPTYENGSDYNLKFNGTAPLAGTDIPLGLTLTIDNSPTKFHVFHNNSFVEADPYVLHNGMWAPATPSRYNGTEWSTS